MDAWFKLLAKSEAKCISPLTAGREGAIAVKVIIPAAKVIIATLSRDAIGMHESLGEQKLTPPGQDI